MPPLPLEPAMNQPVVEEDREFGDDHFVPLKKAQKPAAAARLSKIAASDATETRSLDKTDSCSSLSGDDADAPLDSRRDNKKPSTHVPVVEPSEDTSAARSKPTCMPARPPRRRTQSEPVRPRGILKSSKAEIPISQKATWLNLPKPDMAKLQRSVSTPDVRASAPRRRSSVVFDKIQIREYEQTLGDNPSVSYGPPISLDWQYEEREALPLDDYEHERDPRRSLRQLCMNYYTRRNVLMWSFGYSEEELNKVTKQMEKTKRGRALTKYFLPVAKMEDLVTSAGRKAKRAVGGGGKGKKESKNKKEGKSRRSSRTEDV